MKPVFKFLLSVAAVVLLFFSCKKDESPAQSNKLYSFGFDDDNDSSFEGWTSSSYSFSNDVPPDGGTWSLQLSPLWHPDEGLAETSLSLTAGNYNLKLSADTKTTDPGIGWVRLLLQHSGGVRDTLASASFNNTTWQNISVTAAADVAAGDEIVIQLSAGSTEVAMWNAFFDNVELDKE